MYGDNDNDVLLREGWQAFCQELADAGELIFRDTAPRADIDRAKGLRLLARNIALGLQFQLDNQDPGCPELMHYFDPVRKQGGDNTDALYRGAPINGELSYRISGYRGSAKYFAVTVLEDGNTPWGGGVIASLMGSDIEVDEHGFFEIILSPTPHTGHWIQTKPGAWRVTFREFFADWENEVPMDASIELLDREPVERMLTPEKVTEGLIRSARWVRESTEYWAMMIAHWKNRPHQFMSYRQLEDNDIDATPGGEPLIAYWQVAEDEALIVRVTPPKADYWAVEFGNHWWETMDYRYRLCSTNCHHAVLEDSGELLLVVSHDDPGLPNWLDPSGHEEGYITVRWMGAAHYPQPVCEKVARKDLFDCLPNNHKTITQEQRILQLRARRRGVLNRFKV